MTMTEQDSYDAMLAAIQSFHTKHAFRENGGENLGFASAPAGRHRRTFAPAPAHSAPAAHFLTAHSAPHHIGAGTPHTDLAHRYRVKV